MAYIGNAKTPLLYASNVRDDIVPNGIDSTFLLSQEVPGGYELNLFVVRRRQNSETIISSDQISFVDNVGGSSRIIIRGLGASAASRFIPQSSFYIGDSVTISGAVNAANNNTFIIQNLEFSVSAGVEQCIISTLGANCVTEAEGNSITVGRIYAGEWEVLEPEVDYIVGGVGVSLNKEITFIEIPEVTDSIYAIHRGDATYNFVPTTASVGPEQLQHNLRNFRCDRFLGDGVTTEFALSQEAINGRTILVTVDGIESDGDDGAFVGDWQLIDNGNSLDFHVAPANNAKIKILHLTFSTVSRRVALSPGQVDGLDPDSVDSIHIKNSAVITTKIANSAVTQQKIADNSINGSKILMGEFEGLRWHADNPSGFNIILQTWIPEPMIPDLTGISLFGYAGVQLKVGGGIELNFRSNALSPNMDNLISLGTSSFKYSNIFSNLYNGIDIENLESRVSVLESAMAATFPTGSMIMWMREGAIPAGFLQCNGLEVSEAVYPNLFAVIGSAFNDGSETPGFFRLPNMKGRFAIGKRDSGTASGWGNLGRGGSIDHAHNITPHTHGMGMHRHYVHPHYHGRGNLHISASGSSTTLNAGNHQHGINITSQNTNRIHSHFISTSSTAGRSTNSVCRGINTVDYTSRPMGDPTIDHNHFVTGVSDFAGNHSHITNTHTHSNTNFAGFVGNTSGVGITDGDAFALTSDILNDAGTAQNNNTDANSAINSGSGNPPFQTVLYIIKT